MSIGKGSDFKIYEDEFYGGMFERVAQNTEVFNAASANCLRLIEQSIVGNYQKESFLKTIASLVTRRDLTSVSSVGDTAMTQDEIISVKVNRKIGPVAQALDAWRKIGENQQEMSFKLGGMIGDAVIEDMVNASIAAFEAAVSNQGSQVYDGTAGTLTHGALVNGLAKMGDAAGRIRCWVMHSKPAHDLLGQALTDKITNIADVAIIEGTTASLGRPTIVTDAAALFVAAASTSASDEYKTLGLTEDGLRCIQSEQQEIMSEIVLGLEQIAFRVQGEYAFNLRIKGFQWDVSSGGSNPTDAALATGSNWDKVATNAKDLAGIVVRTD